MPHKNDFNFRLFAIKTWWLEKDFFHYGKHTHNNLTLVGHYTQMVWAATHRYGEIQGVMKTLSCKIEILMYSEQLFQFPILIKLVMYVS